MSALFAVEALIIAAAFVGMLWLRRESDRHWAIYCATRPLVKDLIRLKVQIRDELTPALQRMAVTVAEMAPAFKRFGEAARKAGRQ